MVHGIDDRVAECSGMEKRVGLIEKDFPPILRSRRMGGGMRQHQAVGWTLFGCICALLLGSVGGDWCRDEEFDVGKHTFCVEPSIGPDTGGTAVVIKGFTTLFYPEWQEQCKFPSKWGCVFGDTAAVQPATRVSCSAGYVECVAPSNDSPSDPDSQLPFDVILQVVVNRNTYNDVLPPPDKFPVYFAFFGQSLSQPSPDPPRLCYRAARGAFSGPLFGTVAASGWLVGPAEAWWVTWSVAWQRSYVIPDTDVWVQMCRSCHRSEARRGCDHPRRSPC